MNQDIGSRTSIEHVVTRSPFEDIVALTPKQYIIPSAANDHIIAWTAVNRKINDPSRKVGGLSDVVSLEQFNYELIERRIGAGDIYGR